ncbi:hypothetical protein [Streptomyces beijiangensis]|uniref:PPE family protein n=1 Tax=Streptomyces beijiangensis TaxID=163361 RepID=A0A939FAB6_9ACTN|nr:hypothetical protein [Streptomyces beijiangensis]MBO0515541.1 hypothetical protein [Streptomyces beijiangensis]
MTADSSTGKTEYTYVPASMCYAGKPTQHFTDVDMDHMKAMVRNAKPEEVHNVARGWTEVNNKLVGEGGDGGARHAFMAAVTEVLQHWEGDSADQFKKQADVIAKKLENGGQFAQQTSTAMTSAANVLQTIKPEVEAMQKPSTGNSIVNAIKDGGSRSDTGLKDDLKAGVSTQDALDKNAGDLSAGKEAQLRMAVKMEQLATAYSSQTKAMGTWKTVVDDGTDYPGAPGGTPPVPIIVMPTDSGPKLVGRTPSSGGSSSTANRSTVAPAPSNPNRIGGSSTGSSSKSTAPSGIGTGVDSITTTNPRGTGAGATFGTGTGGLGGGSGSSLGGANGITGAGAGFPGVGGAGAGIGRRGSMSGMGSEAGAGRTGMGGAGGLGSGAGKKGGTGVGGRGPLARTKGGVIGEAEGTTGAGGKAGSGLHGSRGGTAEGRKSAGMGGAGGAAGKKRDKKKDGSDRPDYLVEDEETWVSPDQDVAPRVID